MLSILKKSQCQKASLLYGSTHPLLPSAFPTVVRTVKHGYACRPYSNTESTLQLFLDVVFVDTLYYHCCPARWLHRSWMELSNQCCMCWWSTELFVHCIYIQQPKGQHPHLENLSIWCASLLANSSLLIQWILWEILHDLFSQHQENGHWNVAKAPLCR